ncbi:MAG: cysteine synthase family protein [Chloroflexi bacterium]|nr:cysteine synthase family protein [Chloroflexota bacterium]MCI0783755.1 cysteine synthase family protein [Chloroflexota bacterium]MCI0817689.1 cysteine synthase family protein [Chloroflexota bacterium]MCI0819876.1 cysteine synthase family protein [Chloroflexota bacterium]MCI0831032.1 cysteine synthase family protein [Chloroflexota bacterium]
MHHADILHAIGDTPLVELRHLSPRPDVHLFAKLEGRNPTGSIKDRIVREMVVQAQRDGRLAPGDRIIEASTGNTGIALAMVGRALGYPVRIVIPENVYPEIPRCLAAYGAEITYVPSQLGVKKAIDVARTIAADEGWFMLDQFSDPVNIRAHYEGTGPEILAAVPHVDLFVAGLGTAGTLMGVGRRLKETNPQTRVIAVEPHPGYQVHGLKSLADGFLPPLLDYDVLDGKILVRGGHAFRGAAQLIQRESIFGGVSSGAVLHGALKAIERLPRGNVVLIFADSGWKYLATNMWTQPPAEHEEDQLDDVIWW